MTIENEKHDYQQYEGLPKEERRKRITEIVPKSLETKRFLLSRNPELKKRIEKLSEVVKKLKTEHPEIISLNLCGSLAKGYANEQSDIDATLFVDKNPANGDALYSYYDELIRNRITQNINLQDKQVRHCVSRFITLEEIVKSTENDRYADLHDLFFLSIGRDINRYRKAVFDTLEKMGREGEWVWQRIMEELWYFENKGLPDDLRVKRKKLYPQTLAEGRKIFLQEYK